MKYILVLLAITGLLVWASCVNSGEQVAAAEDLSAPISLSNSY
ncbi:hypothetical protein ACFL2B_00210 [Patescibacteria group bacterium]